MTAVSPPLTGAGPPPSEARVRYAAYAHGAGFSGSALVTALAIGIAESGLDMTAVHTNSNGTKDWGAWQINDVNHPTQEEKTNAFANAKKAFSIYANRGHRFNDWSTFNSGAYRAHLAEAQNLVTQLQKKGPAWERATIAGAGSYDKSVPTTAINIPNPLDALKAIPQTIQNVASNTLTVIVAGILLVMGIILITRKGIGRVAVKAVSAGVSAGTGGASTVAKKAAAPIVKKTVEERAAESVNYSLIRKKLLAEQVQQRNAEARQKFIEGFKAGEHRK
ncbi:MAG TPA: hypothetical protein VIY48_02445 [Candidatus Paceibacterota bacterium]